MAALIYATNVSIDGYIEDRHGQFNLYPHSEEVFAAALELVQSAGTFLYGRRLYAAMSLWETDPALAEQSALTADFAAAWQRARKIVYSSTLTSAATARTRIDREFDPDAVRELKNAASEDITIGGADLAAQALRADLVDECRLFVWPAVLGGGKPAFEPGVRTDFELIDERRFGNGALLLRYRPVAQHA